jgi:hypothetical protein
VRRLGQNDHGKASNWLDAVIGADFPGASLLPQSQVNRVGGSMRTRHRYGNGLSTIGADSKTYTQGDEYTAQDPRYFSILLHSLENGKECDYPSPALKGRAFRRI